MFTSELEILKPIDPSISHSDDYEIYVLSNAHVVYGSNGKPANLLAAYADTPLRVEGRLEPPDRGQLKYLVKKPYKPVDVVIRNVTRFSYGQMTDGELVIWALGEAGWFEIRSRREYKAIYQEMVEAVELLYFVSDIYNEPRKRGGGPGAQLIFQEYVEDERYSCTDVDSAAQIFHKHHEFLIMCFLNRAQGVSWSNTPLYQYYKRQYPVFETARARIDGRYEAAAKATAATKSSPATATASGSQKKKASRGKAQPSNAPPKKDDNWWEAAAIYEFIRSAVIKRVLKPGHNHITLDRVAKLMVKRYEIEEEDIAKNVVLVHAQNLFYKMDHPRSKSASCLADEPLYQELQAGHNLAAADVRRAEAIQLRPRRIQALLSESEDSEDADEALVTPQRRPDGRKKKGRLSVLRPTSSKFSGGKGLKPSKGKGKGKKPNLVEDSSEEEAEPENASANDSDNAIEIDTPTQGLSPRQQKRKFISTAEDKEDERGRRKRTASKSITPESPPSTTEDSEEDSEDENEDVEAPADAPIPLRYRAPNAKSNEPLTKSNVVPPIVSSPLPIYTANGPRDSWICAFDGCSQRIYGVSKDLGRQLITEHLEDHVKGRETVVGILLREEEKLRLPVNNLLKKIREMNEAQTPLFPSPTPGPTLQQQPIRRIV